MQQPKARPLSTYVLRARPTFPSLLIPYEAELYALPVKKIDVDVEFHVSTAFVTINAEWKNVAVYESDCMFALPLNGIVTKVNISIKNEDAPAGTERLLETVIIPQEEVEGIQVEGGAKGLSDEETQELKDEDGNVVPQNPYEEFMPSLFRLPVTKVKSGDIVQIKVLFMEPLYYSDGFYNFTLPMSISGELVDEEAQRGLMDVLSISCTINSITPKTTFESNYKLRNLSPHDRESIRLEAVDVHLDSEGARLETSRDFFLKYTFESEETVPIAIKEEGKEAGEGTFCLFVTPPSVQRVRQRPRNFVFLLDRSGSMTGEPFIEAARSLEAALDTLYDFDKFNVCSFDHNQMHLSEELMPAKSHEKKEAVNFVSSNPPNGGLTDIWTAVEWAMKILKEGDEDALPFIVLITDGCVENERGIVNDVKPLLQAHKGFQPRILTMGIGLYCNWFFLKMLAEMGRGFSDVVMYREKIFTQVMTLMQMAKTPLLTDVSLDVDGVQDLELYPYTIPDLFLGSPLTICGKYRGSLQRITIKATDVDGKEVKLDVEIITNEKIPVSKVFLKQRVDLLTAKVWLENDESELRENVVDLSCSASIPCAYTRMITYERRPDEPDWETQKSMQAGGKTKWYRDKKKLARLAGITAPVVIGAVLFSFGDLNASIGNVPGLGDVAGGDFGGDGCCDDCSCDDFGDCLAC